MKHICDKYEAYLRAKQEAGVYKPEEVDALLAAAKEKIEDAERYEAFQNGTVVREDFANEHVRGSAEGEISFDMYPRQKGETPQQYGERLRMMHEVMNMAKEDAAKEELRKEAEAYAASKLGKYEAYLRAKQEAGVNMKHICELSKKLGYINQKRWMPC